MRSQNRNGGNFNRTGRTAGRKAKWLVLAAAPVAAMLGSSTASALTWDPALNGTGSDGSGFWDLSTANWGNSGTDVVWPNTTSSIAIFGSGGTAAGTVTIDTTGVTANGLTFNAVTGNYTIAGLNSSDTLTLAGTTPTITVSAGTPTISAILAGTSGLTTAGTGTLVLSGANTYSGGTTLTAGILNINGDSALGAVPGSAGTNITFSAASTLQAGSSLINLNANRNVSITSGVTATIDTGGTQTNQFIVNGSISDVATSGTSLSKIGDGILVLAGSNSFGAGSSIIFGGSRGSGADLGIIRLANSNALGTNAVTLSSSSFTNQDDAVVELSGGITIPSTVTYVVGSKNSGDAELRNISGNNTFNGPILLNSSGGQGDIESADPNSTLTLGGVLASGSGNPGTRTFLLYGNGNGIVNGVIENSGTGGSGTVQTVVVGGSANTTWTFNAAETYSGGTPVLNVNGGTAVINYAGGGSFASTTNLTLSGGTLKAIGLASGATVQTFAGTFTIGGNGTGATGGGSNLVINPSTGSGTTITLPNTWTRTAGSTVNFDLSAGSSVISSSPATLTNSIFGYGTVKDATGIGFATITSGQVTRYTSASALTATSNSATTNFSTSGSLMISPAASFAVNSLALDASGGGTLDLGAATDVMTLTTGGLLMTNTTAGNFTILDGQVGAAASEVIVQQFGTGTLTINGSISSGAGSLTKSGPGALVLGGTNAYTGRTTFNAGTISMATDELGAATSPIVFNGGTLQATNSFTLASGHATTIDAAGAVFDVTGSNILTVAGVLAAPGNGVGGGTGLSPSAVTKIDTGTLTLSGVNTYTGGTFINAGEVLINSDSSLGSNIQGSDQGPGNPDINIVFTGNSTLASSASFTLSGNRSVLVDTGVTATIDPLTSSLGVAGVITSQSSSGSLTIGTTGTGTVSLTSSSSSYTVPTIVNSGTLNVSFLANGGSLSSLGASSNAAANLVLANGTTLNYTGGTTSTDRNFTVNSGTATLSVNAAATELTMSGAAAAGSGVIGLNKAGPGTLAFSSTQNYTGATSINAGALLINGSLTGSAVTVAASATIGGNGTLGTVVLNSGGAILSPGDPLTNSGIGTLTAASLTLGPSSVLKFDFGSSTNDQVNVTNSGGLSISGGVLNPLIAGTANVFGTNGTYNLFGYTGSVTGVANLSIGNTAPGHAYSFFNNTSIDEIQLVIGNATAASWNVNGGGPWNVSGNWNPNNVPNAAGEAVTFGSVLTGGTATVDLSGTTETAGQIIFSASTGAYTIANSGSGSLVLNNNSAVATVSVTAAPASSVGSDTISAPISYVGNLNFSDTVSGTSLVLGGGISGSGTIGLQSGTLQIGSGSSSPFTPFSTGPITMASGTSLVFNNSSAIQLSALTAASGASIVQNGTGSVKLASTGNTFNSLQVNNGTFDLNGNSPTLIAFSGSGGGNQTVGTGTITDTSAGAGTSTITDNGTATADYYGKINDGTGANAQKIALVVNLPSGDTLTMHSASTFSGGTALNGGVLAVVNTDANGGGLGTGPITMNGGANAIQLGSGTTLNNNITLNGAAPGVGLGALSVVSGTSNATFGGTITINASTTNGGAIVGPSTGGDLVFAGPINFPSNSTATVLIVRTGYVEFSGAGSSYPAIGITGPGVVSIGVNNGIATNAVAEMGLNNTLGTLDLFGFSQTLAGITQTTTGSTIINSNPQLDGNGNPTNTLTINTSATAFPDTAPDTLPSLINATGGLNLTKSGAGTLLLTNTANTFVGQVTINGGVLGATVLNTTGTADSLGFGNAGINGIPALVFGGGTLRYTGAAATTTDRAFTVTDGAVGVVDVSTSGVALTFTGNGTFDGTESSSPAGFAKGPGLGTLIVTGTAPYHGSTAVQGGVMLVNSPGALGTPGSGSITVAAGAILGGTGTISGSFDHSTGIIAPGATVGATNGNLTFTDPLKLDGGTVEYFVNTPSVAGSGVNTGTQGLVTDSASGGLSFGNSETINLQFASGTLPASFTLNLFDYAGSLGGSPNLTYTSNLGRANFTTDTSTTGELNVDVTTSGAANLNWNSTSSAAWDASSPNWFNTATNASDTFHSADTVNFVDNNAHSTPANGQLITSITLASVVTPGSVTDSANTNNYTISGAGGIGGASTTLTLNGTSTLTLETANTYGGSTTISSGTLNIGGGTAVGSLGTGPVSIAGSATLDFNVAANSTFAPSSISGSGNLIFATVAAANEVIQNADLSSFSGTLTVQSGILRPANATNPLSPGSNVVQNGGEIYFDTGSNHAPATAYAISINGTGTTPVAGATGGDNNGAIRVGSATVTTLTGPITVASNALIGLDGGATLALTNANPLTGSNVTLSLTGGGTLSVAGNVNLGATGALAIGTSPVVFSPPVGPTNISVSSPITGSGAITISNSTAPAIGTVSTVIFGNNPSYSGAITINNGDLQISTANGLGTNAGGTTINGSGAIGNVTGTLLLTTAGTVGAPITIPGNFTLGGRGATGETSTAILNLPAIENVSGVNILSGNVNLTVGGFDYNVQSDAGSLTVQGNFVPGTISAVTGTSFNFRTLQLEGAGNGTWSGVIQTGSTAAVAVNKLGAGTWTLSGVNTYTGPTTVEAGNLTLTDTGVIATTSNTVSVAEGASANINGLLTGTPAVAVNGSMIVGPADANNDPTSAILARNWSTLSINSNSDNTAGSVTLQNAASHGQRAVLVIRGTGSSSGLTFAGTTSAWQGKLDLGFNDMIVKNAGASGTATIVNQIAQAFNNGPWNGGAGITSSNAAASTNTALGYELNLNSVGGTFFSTFDGVTGLTTADVLVKYTYFGDANLDGVVNGNDYTLIDNGFNNKLSGWNNGDFNYDGVVNGDDYTLIDNAFNTQGASLAATPAEMIAVNTSQIAGGSNSVPEPATLSLLAAGAFATLGRRRRRS